MCGIAGIITSNPSSGVDGRLENMVSSLKHRGPDSSGMTVRRAGKWHVGLGHTRLAILDLSPAGHQPMQDAANSRWLTYNGEIYNFQDLKKDLSSAGTKWLSSTDTEVILTAYQKWGVQALSRFRGMFAFALWDEPERQLLLARDPFGIKPLYYYRTRDTFLFASEIRTLLDSGLVPRKLSRSGLASYLETGSCKAPLTILEGVTSLHPGELITVDFKNGMQISSSSFLAEAYKPSERGLPNSRRDAAIQLFDVLKESVRLHLISDVPVGVFLSGGIDSSALVALMKEVSTERPKSFSVIFSEDGFSEAVFAKQVADRFGTEHQEIHVSEDRLLEWLPVALQAMDQPSVDGMNTYVVAKATREAGVTVALSGLGGDELFAGYPSFRRARQLERLSSIPRPIRAIAAAAGKALFNGSVARTKFWDLVESDASPFAAYTVSRRLFSDGEITSLLDMHTPALSAARAQEHKDQDSINAVSELELQGYMANTLLRDSDAMSMASALELRVPFVDAEVIRFVLQIPGAWKVNGIGPKPLLLEALGGLLPEAAWNRPKMGFGFPFERWMRSALRPDIDDALGSSSRLRSLMLDGDAARSVWERFRNHDGGERWSRPWALFVLQKWCDLNEVTA